MDINDILNEINILRYKIMELNEDDWEYDVLKGRLQEMERQLQMHHREIRVGWW